MINLTVVEDNVTITVSEVGPTGPAGQGVPTGGTTGQVLTKTSSTNYATTWANNGTGTVTSVGVTESSAALNITGSPVTTSGNINIGFAGTSAQYVAGDGSLVTFPTTLDEAKRLITQVTNRSGALMTKGTIVYINGAQGNLPTIAKSLATSDATSAQTLGFLQTDIANNASGYVVIAGKIENLDTSAITEGAQLYLSSTIAGTYTTTKQYAPAHLVYVGVVVRSHPTQGSIEVKVQNGYELDEIHNVSAQTPSNNDSIFFNTSTQLWENKSINSVLGVTPIGLTSLSGVAPVSYNNTNGQISMAASNGSVPGYLTTTDWNTFDSKVAPTTSVATTAPLQGGGNLSANRTLSITKSDISTDGYLSSTDWNTFNNKVNSSIQITAIAPLTGGGDLSSNIIIGIPAVSSFTDGYITASDYVDFKNSIKQLGSQTVGYFTKYTGDKAIAQSSVYEDGTTLYLPAIVKQSGLGNSNAVVTDGSGNTVSATIGTGLSLVGGVLTATGTGTGSIGGTGTINYVPKFSGTSSIGNSNIQDSGSLITLGSDTTISSGGLGIGTTSLTGYNLRVSKNISGTGSSFGVIVDGAIQSDVTNAVLFRTTPSTAASAFTLSSLQHFTAGTTTIGSGSTVTNQYGFLVIATAIGATNNYAFSGQLAAATNTWNLYNSGTAPNYMNGSLSIGTTSSTGYRLIVGGAITGSTTSYGVYSFGTIQSDVTSAAYMYRAAPSTAAASFTLTNLFNYHSSAGTVGAGATITNHFGYYADALSIGTNNYGFFGAVAAGTGRWNLFMNGTADNYLSGNLGIGGSQNNVSAGSILTSTLTNGGSGYVDGVYTDVAVTAISTNGTYALYTITVVSGIVTDATLTWGGQTYKVGDTITVSNTLLGGTGSGLIITVSTVDSSILKLSSGTTTGSDLSLYRSSTSILVTNPIGSIKWEGNDASTKSSGVYAKLSAFAAGSSGGAYLSFFTSTGAGGALTEQLRIGSGGQVGIGGAYSLTAYGLRVSKNITGSTISYGIMSDGIIQSDVTNQPHYFSTNAQTAAAAFTTSTIFHYRAIQGTFGAGSTVTSQHGFAVDNTLIGATNNYGFFGNIPSGTNRWNIYMNGTANNYMAGSLGIGSTSLTLYSLRVGKNITGGTFAGSILSNATVQSDVTSDAISFYSLPATAASAFTLTTLTHFYAQQSTIGATSAVTNQIGFFAHSTMIGATNNYGFYGSIASGTNRWNLYMVGTAANYMAGNTGIGTTTTNSFLNIGAGTTAKAQINLASSTAPTTPNDGDIWFDGTALKIRIGGVTKTVTVT